MTNEENFRMQARKVNNEEPKNMDSLNNIQSIRENAELEQNSVKMSGKIPPEMLALIQGNQLGTPSVSPQPRPMEFPANSNPGRPINEQLENVLNKIKGTTQKYTPVELPSKGKCYDGTDGPADGVLHIRPMTGAEEEILATPRTAKGGKGIDMIFRNCIQESINPERLLSIDRTYLLIYLRGISYGKDYEAEIRCPSCTQKFSSTIDLDVATDVEECPDDFDPNNLHDVLPISKLRFSYRLSRGKDEALVQQYRERRIKTFTDANDDTLAYRASLLVTEIENVKDTRQIQLIYNKLPIGDVSYIRNLINEPPFGVNTEIPFICPMCNETFSTDLPLDSNFFFPKHKKKAVQAFN